MKYIPQAEQDTREILAALGLQSTDDIFESVPASLKIRGPLNYPRAQSELELRRSFSEIQSLSPMPSVSFAGGGIYVHDIPSIVPFIQSRSEFSTAYTPYQPEISQGLLQAIYEFQTLVCQLTEMELSNASLYDGATSLAEAVLMGLRLKKKSEGAILVPEHLHPFYAAVLKTYSAPFADRLRWISSADGRMDLVAVEKELSAGADLIVTQSPNVFGLLEDYSKIATLVKASNALWLTSTMEPLSFGLLRGPGSFGAHIVTAEGQSFGNAPFLGGSSYGWFATRSDYLRQLPGRLVGETVDQRGRRSYTLTFATREQFIRRDKATSNICTNQNLNMLAGLIHLVTLGKRGLRDLAIQNHSLSEFAKNLIQKEAGLSVLPGATFNEFCVKIPQGAASVVAKAENEGWVCGIDLGRLKEKWNKLLLITVTEVNTKAQIERLATFLKTATR